MTGRSWFDSIIDDARDERREFQETATTSDYIRETLKMFVPLAIIYRVTFHVAVANFLIDDLDLEDDDIRYQAFAPIIDSDAVPLRVDATARVVQSVWWLLAAIGMAEGFGGGPAAAALVTINVGILVFDPVVFIVDYTTGDL